MSSAELLSRDETLLSIVTSLPIHHMAWRANDRAPWTTEDRSDEAYEETLTRIEDKVARHGWTVVTVPADESAGIPQFAYTVGVQSHFTHPELITVGLPANVATNLLQLCVAKISAGDRFSDNQIRNDLLNNDLRCLIRCVGEPNLQLLGFARRHARRGQLEALQCIWPDKAGRLPGESDYVKSDSQLLLT